MILRRPIQTIRKTVLPSLFFWLAASASLMATIELPPLFANHAVLQRGEPILVWGQATPGQSLVVELRGADDSIRLSGTVVAETEGRWQINFPPQPASQPTAPLSLRIASADQEILLHPVHIGDVWICAGQSNMNFLMRPHLPWSKGVLDWENEVAAANDVALSVFTVPPEASYFELASPTGLWRPSTPTYAEYFSAVPYYFGAALRQSLDIPIGIIVTSLGATSIHNWIDLPTLQGIPAAQQSIATHAQRRIEYADAIENYYAETVSIYRKQALARMLVPNFAPPYPDPYPNWRYQPSGLFNAMLATLEAFPVKGFAWYQGETDASSHLHYWNYLEKLVETWRGRRGGAALPFVLVQLPNHDPVARGADPAVFTDAWAAMREVQGRVLELPATGMAVTADIGEPLEIHPRDKKTVAQRLALAARAVAYGETEIVYSGPRPEAVEVEGTVVRLDFSHIGSGLTLNYTRASGDGPSFELAGPDRDFFPARAWIEGDRLALESEEVNQPVHVRYAYDNNPRLILYNAEELPAAPFRLSLPVTELGRIDFADNSFAAETVSRIRPFALELGPGITASGFNESRGTPPPSFFVRTTSTPETLAEAIDGGHFLKVALQAGPDHLLDLRQGEIVFDLARSTTVGTFSFAVRWSLDDFATDLVAAKIETLNEQFGTVRIPIAYPQLLNTAVLIRIYLWDDLHDSLRAFRLDSFRLFGQALARPGWHRWLQKHFPDSNDSLSHPQADPLGQGIPNLLRYALELPFGGDAWGGLPTVSKEESQPLFRFHRDPAKTDIAYIVHSSSDLSDWAEVLYDSRVHFQPNTDETFMKIAVPAGERLFVRLEIRLLE